MAEQRRQKKEYIRQIKMAGHCIDCGESDWRVLDFDHVRGKKEFGIARAHSMGWKRLREEIAKCELRCANCHRRRTIG